MSIESINNDQELEEALERIGEILDAPEGTAEYDELIALSAVVEAYEDIHYHIDPPDPDFSPETEKEEPML